MAENEKIAFTAYGVVVDDLCVTISTWSDEVDNGGDLKLFFKSYNRDTKAWYDDPDRYKQVSDQLEEAFGVTLDDVLADPECIGEMTEFEAYYDPSRNNPISLRPFGKAYTSYDKLDIAASKALKSMHGDIVTSPVEIAFNHGLASTTGEPYAIGRFEFGVRATVKGEDKLFRVSQICIPGKTEDDRDTIIGLKFLNDDIRDKFAKVDTHTAGNANVEAHILKIAERMAESRRDNIICDRVYQLTGLDLMQMVEQKKCLPVDSIEVREIPANNAQFIIANLDIERCTELADEMNAAEVDEDDVPFA